MHAFAQDQVDVIRQEYENNELKNVPNRPWVRIPRRTEFIRPHPSAHFTVADVNKTAYRFILGDPTPLAEDVFAKYNELLADVGYGDANHYPPVGATQVPESTIIVASHVISSVGALSLRAVPCNASTRPTCPSLGLSTGPGCCDDRVQGNAIVAGPDGVVETRPGSAGTFVVVMKSGWRNPERNEVFSDAQYSRHQWGAAIDVGPKTWPVDLTQRKAYCVLYEAGRQVPHADVRAEKPGTNANQLCSNTLVNHVHVDR